MDVHGDRSDLWNEDYITGTTPWNWWKSIAGPDEQSLYRAVNKALQVGVSSSVNERVFSGWGHIMGKRRTGMGVKRQVKEVDVYTNGRVAKRARLQQTAAAADPATDTEGSSNESGMESETA